MWGLFACRLWGDLTRDGGVNAADSLLLSSLAHTPNVWVRLEGATNTRESMLRAIRSARTRYM